MNENGAQSELERQRALARARKRRQRQRQRDGVDLRADHKATTPRLEELKQFADHFASRGESGKARWLNEQFAREAVGERRTAIEELFLQRLHRAEDQR